MARLRQTVHTVTHTHRSTEAEGPMRKKTLGFPSSAMKDFGASQAGN